MSRYSRVQLDREGRLAARNYRKEQDPEKNYWGSCAKMEFWELIIDGLNVTLQVHLDNGYFVNVAI